MYYSLRWIKRVYCSSSVSFFKFKNDPPNRVAAMKWKDKNRPQCELSATLELEKLIFTVKNKTAEFNEIFFFFF